MEKMLRDALDAEPSAAADGRILAAIRLGAAARRRRRRMRWLAAAAGLAILLGGGLWQHLHRESTEHPQNVVAFQDEGDVMLEIIGMADADDPGLTLALAGI